MTASAAREGPGDGSLGASPATIRAALLPEDQTPFDEAYAAALDEARRTYQLAPVLETVEEWRRRAVLQSDPEAFRRSVTTCRRPSMRFRSTS